ncbi:MAG: hypothetical protein ACE5HJ_01545 [Thermoplasmata archaeon]
MLPEPVRRLAEEIASDTRSGALPLAQKALEAYSLLGQLSGNETSARELHGLLRMAQPWMAAVVNAAQMGWELARSARWGGLPGLKERLADARQLVAREAIGILTECKTVVTVSYSSDVFEALRRRQETGSAFEVYVCESRPLNEGVALARDLKDVGVRATLVVDAAGPSLVARSDAVITGVDSLLREGSLINKIGTMSLALTCSEFSVPFYPIMEVLKVEVEGHEISPVEKSRDPGEVSEDLEALNFYFERVPSRLATSLVTDAGILKVSSLLNRFRRPEDLLSFYLP